jgi:hypothetical protein
VRFSSFEESLTVFQVPPGNRLNTSLQGSDRRQDAPAHSEHDKHERYGRTATKRRMNALTLFSIAALCSWR